jgi:antagonist of KipI
MTLRVLDPGLYTLVVDYGRPHCRSLGVPVGGAADRASLALGNALVGNPPDAAALEFSLAGPTLEAACPLGCIVYGAPFEARVNGRRQPAGTTFTLRPGDVLQVGGTQERMRGYLCVRGGVQSAIVLGSRSGLGPLRAGDEVPCAAGSVRPRRFLEDLDRDRAEEKRHHFPGSWEMLRVLGGAQADWFDLRGTLFAPEKGWQAPPPLFRVTPASNRMGLRLEGSALPVPQRELVSEPVCPGAVQVTRDGQCIILGVDGQTIGGYPKVAQVISADLDVVGQLRPGEQVFFVEVTLEEAERLHREKQAQLARWVRRLRIALDGL